MVEIGQEPMVHLACGGCDVGCARDAEKADGEIAEGGHDLGTASFPDLGPVLVKGHVPDPMHFVLNGPVPSDPVEDLLGIGLVLGGAGDPVGDFSPLELAFQIKGFTFDLKGLLDMGEIQVAIQIVAYADPPDFDSPMPLVCLFNPGGKGPLRRPGIGFRTLQVI